ncbi:MAG: DUF3006 domain-containing protein [Clostridiales bacterium]|nr:DUF3006 domain-containing protein [Clostridiales bacterium]
MKYIIDRTEGNWVICEDENGEMVSISLANIQGTYQDGDVIIAENGVYTAQKNHDTANQKKFDALFKRNKH